MYSISIFYKLYGGNIITINATLILFQCYCSSKLISREYHLNTYELIVDYLWLWMDSHMDNKIAIDKFLNEARKLTARETAIMLFVLRQHDPSVVLTRDNNYFMTMMNNIDLDAERLLFLLNNINSILVSE